MDEETKEVAEEQPTEQTAEQETSDASSDTVQPAEEGKQKGIGKLLSPLKRFRVPIVSNIFNVVILLFRGLRTPVVFNTFNVVILLGILSLLILQPQWLWKKDNLMTTDAGIEEGPLPSEVVDPVDKVVESSPLQEHEQVAEVSKKQSEETAVAVDPETADIIKANTSFERRRYEKALAEYTRVAEQLTPTSEIEEDFVQYRIGKCYQETGRFDDALTTYRNVITGYFESPYHVRAMLGEGECLIESGSFLKGRKHLFSLMAQEAMFSDEDRVFVAEAYYKIAESYMREALRYARIQGYKFANEEK